jgi:hypothetical protein
VQEKRAVFTLSAYPLKMTQLYEIMNKRFGDCHKTKGWIGVEFIREEEEDLIDNV